MHILNGLLRENIVPHMLVGPVACLPIVARMFEFLRPRSRLQLRQACRSMRLDVGARCIVKWDRAMAGQPLLSLRLLALLELGLPAQMSGHARVNPILCGNLVIHQPWRSGPRLSSHGLFDERSKNRLGKDLAIAPDIAVVDDSLLVVSIVQTDEVSGEGNSHSTVRENLCAESSLVPDDTSETLSGVDGDGDMLAGVKVGLELFVKPIDQVVDSRNGLELYATKDGAFQGFGEGLLDFLGTSKLDRRLACRRQDCKKERGEERGPKKWNEPPTPKPRRN